MGWRDFWRRSFDEKDLAEELNTHIELEARKLMARGQSAEEAYRRARVAFGGLEKAREECRETNRWRWLDAAARNGRHGLRSLAKNPAFALISVLILAVGIGANVAVFSTIDALFLRPLPVSEPGRLVEIFSVDKQGHKSGLFSRALDPLARSRAFQSVCGVATHYEAVEIEGTLRTLGTAAFSGNCFETIGLRVQLGRALDSNDDHIGAERVAIITDSFWREQFGARSDVLGRSIRIGSEKYTIVGVADKPFTGLLLGFPEPVMIPLLAQPDYLPDGSRPTSYYVNVLARRAAGISETQALASLQAERKSVLEESVPHRFDALRRREYVERSVTLAAASSGVDYFLRNRFGQPLYAVFGLCAAMLLMACVNLSSLLLARSLRRQREIGIRLALGAGRGHIVAILVFENVLLVLAGAVGGILAGWAIARALLARGGQVFANFDLTVGFDARVIAFVLGTIAVVVAAFVAASLWQARHLANAETLKQSGRSIIAPNTSAQKMLLTMQIAITLALVTGTALFRESVVNMYRIDFGIQPQNVWIARLAPKPGGYREPSYWKSNALPYYRRLLTDIEALPGIGPATFTDTTPFLKPSWESDIARVEGGQIERGPQVHVIGVADNYFATLGGRIVAGDDFTRARASTNEPGVILSESLARHLGGERALLGQHVRIGSQPDLQKLKVVGIAGNMDMNLADLDDTKPFTAFISFWEHQNLLGYPTLLFKTHGSEADAARIRAVVERNGHEFVEGFSTVEAEIDNALIENRFLAWLSGAFSVLALAMAAVGLFGLLSYQVSNRTAEIGVRLALGAEHGQIRGLILGQAIRSLGLGLAAGIALTVAIGKLLGNLLYGVTAQDPVVWVSATAVLSGIALLAAWIPVRRAERISPVEALRHE